jgi:hypothetical protein
MNASEIETIVDQLIKLKSTKSVAEIELLPEFNDFKLKNKLLFDTVLSESMDYSVFKKMMQMKRKLEDGESQYSVDVKFGKFMAEKYIDPVVKKK